MKLLDSSSLARSGGRDRDHYAANGKVMSVAKTGGAPRELGPPVVGEEAFAVDAGYVYWTDIVDSQIRRLPEARATSAPTLVAGERSASAVDATGTYLPAYGCEIGRHDPDYIAKSGYKTRRREGQSAAVARFDPAGAERRDAARAPRHASCPSVENQPNAWRRPVQPMMARTRSVPTMLPMKPDA